MPYLAQQNSDFVELGSLKPLTQANCSILGTPGGYPGLAPGWVSPPTTEKIKKAFTNTQLRGKITFRKTEISSDKEQAVRQNDPIRSVKNDVKTF